jgi:hypothetical protein
MKRLESTDLMTLEAYARERAFFRARVIAHKRRRTVAVGPNITLLFEDRLTVQYQVQEMLRIERIFEASGIADELSAYNPLIPDGGNLKATMLIEFADPTERAAALRRLRGVERHVVLAIGDVRIPPVCDEDLERENAEKTSAVHFVRYEIPAALRATFVTASVAFEVEHPDYRHSVALDADTRAALAADLD